MKLNRRTFIAGCAGLPVLTALHSAPILAQPAAQVDCVGEVWGLSFWGKGALPVAAARRKPASIPPAWHPEFP